MTHKSGPAGQRAEQVVKDIRRPTRRHFLAEEKKHIVVERLRDEDSSPRLAGVKGIEQKHYCWWSKEFLEAGQKWLTEDIARAANSEEVKDLRRETSPLKEVVADFTLENRLLKKNVTGDGEDAAWDTRPPRSWKSSNSSSNRIGRSSTRNSVFQGDVLSLVRPVPDRWTESPRRSFA